MVSFKFYTFVSSFDCNLVQITIACIHVHVHVHVT